MSKVTDPELLRQLNSKVSDPKLLTQLEGKPAAPDAFDERIKADLKESGGYLENIGAGMDNVWQGAKQLVGQGRSDADIEESRKIKEGLAEGRTGGGATQLAGEILASLPLTLGAGGAVAKGVTKAIPAAANWAMKGGRTANLGLVGRGAVEGAAGGALAETTEDESGGLNTGIGTVVGAALPMALAAGGKIAQVFRKKHAPVRAAKEFDRHLGKTNMDAIADALDSPRTSTLPLSTAAETQNPALAALERGARNRSTGNLDWASDHDRKVAAKAWEQLKGATGNADELPARIADRESMMAASKKDLEMFNYKPHLKQAADDVSDAAQQLRSTSIARQNPEITNLIGETESMLRHPDMNAGDYASQYWRLSGMLDDAKLPPEHREVIMKLRDAVHQGGDTATGGQEFSDMLGRYMAEQGHVGQAQSSKAIRETFMTPEGVIPGKEVFGSPEITSHQLRRTLASKGADKFGSSVDDPTRSGLDKLQKELSQHELYKGANSPGATNIDSGAGIVSTLGSGANNPFNRIWALRGASNMALRGSRMATGDAAENALQSPQAWREMMEAYAKSKTPLSPQEYAARMRRQLMMLPGRTGAAGTGGE